MSSVALSDSETPGNTNTQRVINALENPKYHWRTSEGIAKETGLSLEGISQIIVALGDQDQVIQSSTTDTQGRFLYTTRRHYKQTENPVNRLLSVLSDRVK